MIRSFFGCFFVLTLALSQVAASSAAVTSYVVTIDSNTAQPVGTGFVPQSADGNLLLIVDGAVRVFANPARYELGWFGEDGQNRLQSSGQPIVDGMPYGAVVGGFNSSIPSFQYYGANGAKSIQPANVGQEFRVALNMSNADLTSLQGSVTITVIHVPNGEAEISQVIMNDATTLPAPTGLVAASGDRFIFLSEGAFQQGTIVPNPLNGSVFGPSGLVGFNRSGQPLPEGPYGALYGSFDQGAGGFFLGRSGSWSTEIADEGDELFLLLNIPPADQATLQGVFVVSVIRIPGMSAAAPEMAPEDATLLRGYPNPTNGSARVGFRLAGEEMVRLRIYDAQGRWVRNLLHETLPAGAHEVAWDGLDDNGQAVASGSYFFQLSRGEGSSSGRIVLSR